MKALAGSASRTVTSSVGGKPVYDHNKARQVEIEAESDDEGTADYTIPEPFADEDEAKNAATAKADHLKSETIRTSVTVFGDPAIRAGAPFTYSGVRPGIDGIEFIIESATHRIDKSGYTTQIEAKLKPEQKKGKGSGDSDGDGTAPPTPSVPDPKPSSVPGGIGHA
jgi:phage protein D